MTTSQDIPTRHPVLLRRNMFLYSEKKGAPRYKACAPYWPDTLYQVLLRRIDVVETTAGRSVWRSAGSDIPRHCRTDRNRSIP